MKRNYKTATTTQTSETDVNGHKGAHKKQKRGAAIDGNTMGDEPDSSADPSIGGGKTRRSKARGKKRQATRGKGEDEQRETSRAKKARTKEKVVKHDEEEEEEQEEAERVVEEEEKEAESEKVLHEDEEVQEEEKRDDDNAKEQQPEEQEEKAEDEKQEEGSSSSKESEEERGEGLESGQESKSTRYLCLFSTPLTQSFRGSQEEPPADEEDSKKGTIPCRMEN